MGTLAEIPPARLFLVSGLSVITEATLTQSRDARLFPGFSAAGRPVGPSSPWRFISSEKGIKDQFHFDRILSGAARLAADRERAAPAELSAGKT